ALEKELGVPLLRRIGKATRLTPAGEVLLQCATQVLDKLEEVQRVLAEDGDGRATIVRLGTPEPACVHLVPPLLVEIKRRLPKIDVRITSGHTGATLARLIGGEIDLGLLPLPVEPKRMRITELGRDELVAVVPAWAVRREVAAGVLAVVALGRTSLVRSWGLIYPEKRQLPPMFRSLVRLCGDLLPPLLSPTT